MRNEKETVRVNMSCLVVIWGNVSLYHSNHVRENFLCLEMVGVFPAP